MWNLPVIITLIIAITSPKWSVGVPCSDETLRDCEAEILKYLHSVDETGYDAFCEDLRNDSNCPRLVPEDCKKHFPAASTLYTVFMERMHTWCNRSSEDRRIWFKVGFCATKNPKDFHKCFKMRTIKNETESPDQQSIDCEFYDFLYCMSEQVLKKCGEEREFLSKYIEASVHESYQEYCKGSTGNINNYWILDLLAFLSLLLSHKFLH
ncbi:hypothetical protein AVEN_270511-1 [Araneus ventricosus]|uniref:DUF19 domain-containing protein n=1 Tax=Araneus ventricosus TaxID=182803 RepID=A0A4Y2B5B5_ARAVE|nr:hypothetical protein AVEN_270511-1 [Araneus ventricosus]